MNADFGLGAPLSEIEVRPGVPGSFYDAANVCDEQVQRKDGSYENRYTINCSFKTDEAPSSILEKMATAIGGFVTYANGKWKCFPGTWRAPTVSLNEDQILSDIEVKTLQNRRECFNGVRGTFTSPTKNYQEDDFPAATNAYYVLKDGGQKVWDDITLPYTNSASACQRLAKLYLEKMRQQTEVSFQCTLKAYELEVGEVVNLNITRLGYVNKPFEVTSLELVTDAKEDKSPCFYCAITLRETASGVFDWANGEETTYDLSPNTELPNCFNVIPLTGLAGDSGTNQLYITADGTVVSRLKLTWDAATDAFVSSGGTIEVDWQRVGDAGWSAPVVLPGNSSYYYILDVQDGALYNARIRPRNSLKIYGDYTQISNFPVVGKTAAPSDVSGVGANLDSYGISIFWTPIVDLDADRYEIRIGAVGDNWESATLVGVTAARNFTTPLKAAGIYRYFVKAIDTTGNYSANACTFDLTIGGPGAVTPTFLLSGQQVTLSWAAATSQIPIAAYAITYGTTFPGTSVGSVQGTSYQIPVTWSGVRRFWVNAVDVGGNSGTAGSVDVTINPPGAVSSITGDTFDNYALLKWTAPAATSLPISGFNVYKGTTFAGAVLIGTISSTFFSYFETSGGSYTYWVAAVDILGTIGTPTSITVRLLAPPDYVLYSKRTLVPADFYVISSMLVENGIFKGPINTNLTWTQHFANKSWNTIQDQINSGNVLFLMPAVAGWQGDIWSKLDYGATIAGAIVNVSYLMTQLNGSNYIKCRIGHSTDNTNWTWDENTTKCYKTNFRYIQIQITLWGTNRNDFDVASIENVTVQLDIKQKNDGGGPLTCLATDAAGTCTVSIATPASIGLASHGLLEGQQVIFTTTGALPTGLTAGQTYIVRNPTLNAFNVAVSEGTPTLITTTGTQSGTHTVTSDGFPVFFNTPFIDIDSVTVTACPTAAQGTANFPWTPIVAFLDAPNPLSFGVRFYDRTGARVASDFRWACRGK